ncbi:MAG: SGNH/GDSL hydrolase family protein [Verrucomicrobiae bacterium]|nr:SGNH/GDSL hydrolase family protein [Verrucomicrobiae bacterium]
MLSRRKKVLFGLVTMAFVLGAMEFALRILLLAAHKDLDGIRKSYANVLDSNSRGHSAYVTDHPYLPHLPRASSQLISSYDYPLGGRIERRLNINSLGFRGPELQPRDARTFRVACLGGSTVEGCLSDPWQWPGLVGENLARLYPDRRVEVINAGVSNYASTDTLLRFVLQVLPLRPDCVVVYDGVNDLFALGADEVKNDFSHIRKRLPCTPTVFDYCPRWFERSALFVCVRRVASDLWLHRTNNLVMLTLRDFMRSDPSSTSGREIFRRNLMNLAFLCRGYGIRMVVCTFNQYTFDAQGNVVPNPQLEQKRAALNGIVRQVARETGADLLELENALPADRRHYLDGAHFTRVGEEQVARLVSAKIRAMYGPKLQSSAREVPSE